MKDKLSKPSGSQAQLNLKAVAYIVTILASLVYIISVFEHRDLMHIRYVNIWLILALKVKINAIYSKSVSYKLCRCNVYGQNAMYCR